MVGQVDWIIIFRFFLSVAHQLFAGMVVPASLFWAASPVLSQAKSLNALLATIVGTLWYGPDEVQGVLQRVAWTRTRYEILLRVALGSYHCAAIHRGVRGELLSKPAVVRRRLRFFLGGLLESERVGLGGMGV